MEKEFHVSVQGNDTNEGTLEKPFRTISFAAEIAEPGDVVTVHEGIYREWVDPKRGGNSNDKRIIYQAAHGEKVTIAGSEIITSWENVEGSVWKATIPNTFFGDYNPYIDKIHGDWFYDSDRIFHTGEVYLNGKSLYEMESLKKVINPTVWPGTFDREGSTFTWYCESDSECTAIWANFHEYNPKENLIEINVRPFCFWPQKTGLNYITVCGFTMKQAATQWAPPTALQTGLIGTHWSKGWIIENNNISDSKCSGISLGKEKESGQNPWTESKRKLGSQYEREVIFKALHFSGWSKENIGSHIVRNNTIFNCEQTGICGHLGGAFCEITGNHIYNINTKRMLKGPEIAGIKLHAAIDTILKNNHIHNAFRGMWMDWQAQGTRISQNLFYDNIQEDLFVEVSHGPYIVDNNIFLSTINLKNLSQGGAFVNNLFAGAFVIVTVPERFTPYHFPHSTAVAGVMTILTGDDRFYNNIFIGNGSGKGEENIHSDLPEMIKGIYRESQNDVGLEIYNVYPEPGEDWYSNCQWEDGYYQQKLPIYCGSNLYFNGAKPYVKEKGSAVFPEIDPQPELITTSAGMSLNINFDGRLCSVGTQTITTEFLGKAFETEASYENADGSPIRIDTDFFGEARLKSITCVGPFKENCLSYNLK